MMRHYKKLPKMLKAKEETGDDASSAGGNGDGDESDAREEEVSFD